jgi:uncharacterized protein (DUF433 family)
VSTAANFGGSRTPARPLFLKPDTQHLAPPFPDTWPPAPASPNARLSVSLILECLAGGMSLEDIDKAFDSAFPREALPEVLKLAAELTNSVHVAA